MKDILNLFKGFSELIWAALSRICARVRGKIKNKVFDWMLSTLNPSLAAGSAEGTLLSHVAEIQRFNQQHSFITKLCKQPFTKNGAVINTEQALCSGCPPLPIAQCHCQLPKRFQEAPHSPGPSGNAGLPKGCFGCLQQHPHNYRRLGTHVF